MDNAKINVTWQLYTYVAHNIKMTVAFLKTNQYVLNDKKTTFLFLN